jgi:hypothetical protein
MLTCGYLFSIFLCFQDPNSGLQAFAQFAPTGYPMADPNQAMSMWGAPSQPVIIDDIAEDDIQVNFLFQLFKFKRKYMIDLIN